MRPPELKTTEKRRYRDICRSGFHALAFTGEDVRAAKKDNYEEMAFAVVWFAARTKATHATNDFLSVPERNRRFPDVAFAKKNSVSRLSHVIQLEGISRFILLCFQLKRMKSIASVSFAP